MAARKGETAEEFMRDLLSTLGHMARRRAVRAMGSRTLQRMTRVVISKERFARVVVPHYWAIYHHDGRRAIDMTNRPGFMVFFEDPRDDPRTDGTKRYPVQRKDIQHLTKAQFEAGLEENTRRRKAGIETPYMIVTKRVGPADGTHFFSEGLKTFPSEAAHEIRSRFRTHLLLGIDRDVRDVARARL